MVVAVVVVVDETDDARDVVVRTETTKNLRTRGVVHAAFVQSLV